jgi:flagellar protein FlaG
MTTEMNMSAMSGLRRATTPPGGEQPAGGVSVQQRVERTQSQPSVPVTGATDVTGGARAAEAKSEELGTALRDINLHMQSIHRNLNFSIDEGSERTVIKVIDAETDETIRQIPSEEVLVLARRLKDAEREQQGLFFNVDA